jgi:hypothetical protein
LRSAASGIVHALVRLFLAQESSFSRVVSAKKTLGSRMAARAATKRQIQDTAAAEDEFAKLAQQRAGSGPATGADGPDKEAVEMELRALSSSTGRPLSASRQPAFDATFGTGDHWQTATEKTRLLEQEEPTRPDGAAVDNELPVDPVVDTNLLRASLIRSSSLVTVTVEEPEDEKMPKDKVVAEEVHAPLCHQRCMADLPADWI